MVCKDCEHRPASVAPDSVSAELLRQMKSIKGSIFLLTQQIHILNRSHMHYRQTESDHLFDRLLSSLSETDIPLPDSLLAQSPVFNKVSLENDAGLRRNIENKSRGNAFESISNLDFPPTTAGINLVTGEVAPVGIRTSVVASTPSSSVGFSPTESSNHLFGGMDFSGCMMPSPSLPSPGHWQPGMPFPSTSTVLFPSPVLTGSRPPCTGPWPPNMIRCDHCAFVSYSNEAMKAHVRQVHPTSHSPCKYKCEICGALIKWKHNYTNHMRYAHANKLLRCDLCSFTTKWRSNWLQHQKTAHHNYNASTVGFDVGVGRAGLADGGTVGQVSEGHHLLPGTSNSVPAVAQPSGPSWGSDGGNGHDTHQVVGSDSALPPTGSSFVDAPRHLLVQTPVHRPDDYSNNIIGLKMEIRAGDNGTARSSGGGTAGAPAEMMDASTARPPSGSDAGRGSGEMNN